MANQRLMRPSWPDQKGRYIPVPPGTSLPLGLRFLDAATECFGSGRLGSLVGVRRAPIPPKGRVLASLGSLTYASDSVEGPLDLFPRIQQSDWTSMRAASWVFRFRKFQQ